MNETWIVVLTTESGPEYFGPWTSERDARSWEDQNLDAPPGSRAVVVQVNAPS